MGWDWLTRGGWKGVGVGEAFGAAVINMNGSGALELATGVAPQPARKMLARKNNRRWVFMKSWWCMVGFGYGVAVGKAVIVAVAGMGVKVKVGEGVSVTVTVAV